MIPSDRQISRWHYQVDTNRLLLDLREAIHDISQQAILQRGCFSIVLAGGSTPEILYKLLVFLDTDWSRWEIYFGDERCLPVGHVDRNDTMADRTWLDHVAVPQSHIHRIGAENGKQGAVDYSVVLESVKYFDLVLLGLGEDGHTASLFPGDETGFQDGIADALFIANAPKLPSQRITLSAKRLSMSNAVWFLSTGRSKYSILKRWRSGELFPASRILPENGVDIFTDQLLD